MRRRCPGARPLHTADLPGWTFVFETGSGTHAFANVRPCEGSVVHGALFEIGPRDLASLDRYEDYPELYDRTTMGVDAADGTVDALVYVMVAVPQTRFAKPLARHLDAVAAGYADWGLDPSAYERALAMRAQLS
jgi:gamma-glutamylcyclotransferase (GGCT)/AIG2-like uncharacterized protein YtfP